MEHGQAARTAHGAEIGAQRDAGHLALAGGLEEGATGGVEGVDAPNAQGDKVRVGESEVGEVALQGGDEVEGGIEEHVANESIHWCPRG